MYSDGMQVEGLFEKGEYRVNKSEVKSYNPNIHLIAKKIEIDEYMQGQ